MSCEQTTFSLVLVKMQRGKRLRSQTKEVVANVYDYFEEVSIGIKGLKDLLNEPLMPKKFHVPASIVIQEATETHSQSSLFSKKFLSEPQ